MQKDITNTYAPLSSPEPSRPGPTSIDESEIEDADSTSDSSSGSEAFEQFKTLTQTNEIGQVQFEASTLMQLLGLGKVKKGASDMKSKYKSLTNRWYNQVTTKKTEAINKHDSDLVLERDSIVNLEMKRGGAVEISSYRVLSLFTMYNKN